MARTLRRLFSANGDIYEEDNLSFDTRIRLATSRPRELNKRTKWPSERRSHKNERGNNGDEEHDMCQI